VTSPPPPAPRSRPGGHAAPSAAGVTRIVHTDDLPPGVDALASADGKTIIVRASLDQADRRRVMREVMASIRRYPRLALFPALSIEAVRHLAWRIYAAMSAASQSVQQAVSAAGDRVNGLAVAATAAVGTVAVVTVVVTTASPAASTGGTAAQHPPAAAGTASAGPHRIVRVTLPDKRLSYLGVYVSGVPDSFGGVTEFAAATQVHPNIALYYSSWFERFKTDFAVAAHDSGMTPAVQIEPFGVSLADIADGRYDKFLDSYASAVRDFGQAVIIGFAHEPNGSWYPWGLGHVSPATWIAAWQHVVTVFRQKGADNVIWLWTVNSQGPDGPMAGAWWPGSAYVTWVGVDGYYTDPGDTFENVFGTVLGEVRGFGKPIIISETAVGPGTGDQAGGIENLFAGLRASRLLGLIWFDVAQDHGQYQQDWRLEGHPALESEFRKASRYLSS
jgi:Glycosyl hydrolase family 26